MDQSPNPLSGEANGGEKSAAPANLLEEKWFFNNFLDRKASMSRDSDHPSTSSGDAGKSYDEAFESIEKLPRPSESRPPPPLVRKDSNPIAKGGAPSLSGNLARVPSMPASLPAPEEIQDHEEEEIEFSMGKLIRQASLKSSDARKYAAKGGATTITSSNTSSRTKAEFGSRKLERLRPRRAMNQLKTQKSLSDLESFELQGFKDLGFDVGLKKPISMIPESHEEDEEGKQAAPKKRSKEDDMKAQIKFWARAVASNVNQE